MDDDNPLALFWSWAARAWPEQQDDVPFLVKSYVLAFPGRTVDLLAHLITEDKKDEQQRSQ